MLAGLMAATVLGGVAPAMAAPGQDRDGRDNRVMRQGGGDNRGDGRGGNAQRARMPGMDRPQVDRTQAMRQRAVSEARPSGRFEGRTDARQNGRPSAGSPYRPLPEQQRQGWGQRRDNDNRADARPTAPRPDNGVRPGWNGTRPGTGDRDRDRDRDWNRDRDRDRDNRWADRRDDDHRWDGRRNDDRRSDDRRWDGRRDDWNRPVWNNGGWNNGRRYDDRTRWADQRRWDNRWRNDRRYDWYSYRARYGDRYRMGRYYAPRGWNYGYQRFSIGIFMSSGLYANNYWLNDPWQYRLPPAYGNMRWVRYYDDALLVDIRDGYVVDVIHDFFW